MEIQKIYTYDILLKSYFSDSNSRVTSTIKMKPYMGIELRKRDNLRVDFSPKHTLGKILLNSFKKEAITVSFFCFIHYL